MSLLTDFATAAFASARTIIGGESVVIGTGDAVSCVLNEYRDGRGYEVGGFDEAQSLEAVADLTEFVAAYASASSAYLGKKVTVRGRTMRIADISKGQSFVTLSLVGIEQGG